VWLRRRKEVAPSEIAKELNVSRPFVSKAHRIAKQRVSRLLKNAAAINRITLNNSSPDHGFAVGYCPGTEATSYITFSPRFGVHVWFDHEGDCSECNESSECWRILTDLAEDWQIKIPSNIPPTDFASMLFKRMMETLRWNGEERE
jgi:hypothetical protein